MHDDLTIEHLSAQQLADRLGVPLNTVYAWRAHRKGPPAMRIGKYVRYRLADVHRWEQGQVDKDHAARGQN